MPYCETNGISLYYEVKGVGEPLMLIAGISADITIWPLSFLDELAENYQVIIFDNRGVGKTDAPKEFYSMEQFVEDTIGLINYLNLDKIHLYGESMGGMIAQNLVLEYLKVVKSLILAVTTVGKGGFVLSDESKKLLDNHRKGDFKKDLWKFLEFIYTQEYIDNNRVDLNNYVENAFAYPTQKPQDYRNQLLATYNHQTKNRLSEISIPVLILVGMKDKLISPDNSLLIHKLIPHSKLIEYEKAAHMYRFEAPQAVKDIVKFIKSLF